VVERPTARTITIQPRSAWTRAGPRRWLADPMHGVSRITVHHDGMPPVPLRGRADVTRRIESIRRSHVAKGWADIGYHYVIDPFGRVWQARPVSLQGAHVKYHNPHNLGIMVLGNFEVQRPTPAALASVDAFVTDRMRAYGIPLARVYTHRELRPTACPGRNLQRHMVLARGRGGSLVRA